ncbi:MAG: peptide chain release factor N(5)-glutamine methyltransferase [Sulfurospirillum sp.]|nr:peptide chain release factor N(5)-glutamine methyltransferase [Sulfurospirillum sp.]
MNIKEILAYASVYLKDVSEIPNKESRILLAHLLGCDILWLITHEDTLVTCEKHYQKLLERRVNHEPIEYITSKVSFYGEDFFVDKRVLIPRPETELLVDLVALVGKEFQKPRIVEIGCGSGVISIMLAKLLPQATITAIDISHDALDVAYINAKALHVDQKIKFLQSDLLANFEQKKFDILVSNPPYIANDESLHVGLSYEPDLALFGGVIGDEILVRIIDAFLCTDAGILACEMGYDQREKIAQYLKKYGLVAEFYKDLAGLDRGFILKKEL